MKYIKKSVEVEAITFDELVEYGRTHGANIVNGMPWSFEWNGYAITHENDECYIIDTMNIRPGQVFIEDENGDIRVRQIDYFKSEHDPLPDLPQSATDILDSKVVKIDNILTDMRTNRIDHATCGALILKEFSKEIHKYVVAKKLLKLLLAGNGTGHKEVEELRREWEMVSGDKQ